MKSALEATYDLCIFEKGEIQAKKAAVDVQTEIDLERVYVLQDLVELDQWDLPDWCLGIIVDGSRAEDAKRYEGDRSKAQFSVSCELVRRGVPDDVHFGLLLDPKLGVSESVIDKKGRIEKYALRQIEEAKKTIEAERILCGLPPTKKARPALPAAPPRSPEEVPATTTMPPTEKKLATLEDLNKEYFVSWTGGKCRVFTEHYDEALRRSHLQRISFTDFQQYFQNRRVKSGEDSKGNPKFEPLGDWWLAHPKRRQYRRVVFSPGKDTAPDVYNLWKGFAVEARPGSLHQSLLDHMHKVICSKDLEHFKYLLGWMATCVQFPAQPGEVAIVLRGKQGTGKGQLIRSFGYLFGRHYLQVSNPKHLVGNFNSHLRDCVVLFADEAFYAGDKAHESILKTLITEPSITIEAKGIDIETSPNFIHLFMASNAEWVVPAGAEERRYFVLDVSEEKMQNTSYFGKIIKDLQTGGYENLLWYLQNYDLEDFNVRKVPQTVALSEQKALNLRGYDSWIVDLAYEGRLPEGDTALIRKSACSSDNLLESCLKQFRNANKIGMGKFLRKLGLNRCPDNNAKAWIFPSLSEFRKILSNAYGVSDWAEDDGRWTYLAPMDALK